MKLTEPVIGGGPRVRVEHIAFDSLGVKSMCTLVRTPDVAITIDPGVSLASPSFPLPETVRRELLQAYLDACRKACAASQAIVVSHYHLDHFSDLRDSTLYGGKVLFLKSLEGLPQTQADRAQHFAKTVEGLPTETVWADGRRFRFKKTEVSFSKPTWHGRHGAEPGTVIMTEVKRGRERVLVTSDVGGPTTTETTELICSSRAQTVILDGYPTYQLGRFALELDLVKSITNVGRILAMPGLKTLVLDHHVARDYRYPALLKLCYSQAKRLKKRFGTAAELAGRTSMVLEGLKNYGPTKWHKWAPLERADARRILEKGADPAWLQAFDRWVG